jgi:hypothetical protein
MLSGRSSSLPDTLLTFVKGYMRFGQYFEREYFVWMKNLSSKYYREKLITRVWILM